MPERLEGSGEHRAMLFFSELVDSSQAAVQINFRLGIPVYAQLGEVDQTAPIHDLKIANDRSIWSWISPHWVISRYDRRVITCGGLRGNFPGSGLPFES